MWSTGILGALVLVEGLAKLFDPHGYVHALAGLRVLPASSLVLVAALWTCVEIAAGASLLYAALSQRAPRMHLGGALGALAAALGYAALTSTAWMRGVPVDNCTCFGSFLAQRLSWLVLLQDAYVLAWTAFETGRAARRFSSVIPRTA